jgi:hypothetical protein
VHGPSGGPADDVFDRLLNRIDQADFERNRPL